jgi:hypothetical protein
VVVVAKYMWNEAKGFVHAGVFTPLEKNFALNWTKFDYSEMERGENYIPHLQRAAANL